MGSPPGVVRSGWLAAPVALRTGRSLRAAISRWHETGNLYSGHPPSIVPLDRDGVGHEAEPDAAAADVGAVGLAALVAHGDVVHGLGAGGTEEEGACAEVAALS